MAASDESPDRTTRLMRGLTYGLGAVLGVLAAWVVVERFRYPMDGEWMTGAIRDGVDRLVAGQGRALDDDPNAERSAEALESLLIDRQEWKDLARFYRRALKRLGGETSDGKNGERLRLWSAMGELCLDKLGERESAIEGKR